MKIVNFHYSHLDLMEVRKIEVDEVLSLDNVRVRLQNLPPGSEAISLVESGRIIACAGLTEIAPGIAECWLIPSQFVGNHGLAFVREIKRQIEFRAEVHQWHRVQTITRTDSGSRKWMKTLGFAEEGVMLKYVNRQDYVISARYFTWE